VRQITTSAIGGNVTAVTSGLSPGERVVVDGTDRLRDGLKVAVAADQAATPNNAVGGQRAGGQHGEHGANPSQKSDGSQPPPRNGGQ
jgi:multidrug efflux system membrane fusion protein